MSQVITRRLLTKKIFLAAAAFAFFGVQDKSTNSTSPLNIQSLDEHYLSVNGWIVSKSDLIAKGKFKNAG